MFHCTIRYRGKTHGFYRRGGPPCPPFRIPDLFARLGLIEHVDIGLELGVFKIKADLKWQHLTETDEWGLAMAIGGGAQAEAYSNLPFTLHGDYRPAKHTFAALYLSKQLLPPVVYCLSYQGVWSAFQIRNNDTVDNVEHNAYSHVISTGFFLKISPNSYFFIAFDYMWPGEVYGKILRDFSIGVITEL